MRYIVQRETDYGIKPSSTLPSTTTRLVHAGSTKSSRLLLGSTGFYVSVTRASVSALCVDRVCAVTFAFGECLFIAKSKGDASWRTPVHELFARPSRSAGYSMIPSSTASRAPLEDW
jgi:hypothetical protein